MGVGIQGGVGQEQTHVQVVHRGAAGEDQTVDIHQHQTRQIEQVEPEGSPLVLNGPAQGEVAQKANGGVEKVSSVIGQGIGKQPPHLTLQNQGAVKIEDIVQHGIAGDLGHQIHHGTAHADIQHQVGNALVPVAVAQPVKFLAQIFQLQSTPKAFWGYSISKFRKSP